jgi:hypothetical protein
VFLFQRPAVGDPGVIPSDNEFSPMGTTEKAMTEKTTPKTQPMTIRDENGRVHVASDMKPADNRRVDQPEAQPLPTIARRNPD